ncbi:MAG: HEAT repeat domain-containing protein [Myxococcales bacterium]|nr:HEAT repeat domain-containing protein [Myxococcales bacterium]
MSSLRETALRDIQSDERSLIVAAGKVLADDKASTSVLVELLGTERRPENRQAILYALAWHSDVSAVPGLWDRMVEIVADTTEHPKVRGQAAEVLAYAFLDQQPGTAAFTAAVEVLIEATKDPSPEVRYCAANTIGSSGYLPLRPHLEALLGDRDPVEGWVGSVADEAERSMEWLVAMDEQRRKNALKK